MDKCAAIIVAGGSGKRFGSRTPKQFLELSGIPVYMRSVNTFKNAPGFSQIVLVAPKASLARLQVAGRLKGFEVVAGGKERSDSVRAGLKALKKDISIVAIHDAARPLIKRKTIARAVRSAVAFGSGIVSVPARDTVKLAPNGGILNTIPRETVWLAQTPQVFKRPLIEKAYSKLGRARVTDDAQVMERISRGVRVVMGDYNNIKITDRADFKAAQKLLDSRERERMLMGIGYDVHRLKKGRPLILGGVQIPNPKGLDGHSDADALVHAVMDALLGAAGLSDIGHVFPNCEPKYKNADSIILLKEVMKILSSKKLFVNNIDTTVICEAPKISPHINKMKKILSGALKLSSGRIGIKATTNEGLGFIGHGEGIAAFCVATLRKK